MNCYLYLQIIPGALLLIHFDTKYLAEKLLLIKIVINTIGQGSLRALCMPNMAPKKTSKLQDRPKTSLVSKLSVL